MIYYYSRVRGIYEYRAQGDDELDLNVGEVIDLTSGPTGGQNYGEGWWEGELVPVRTLDPNFLSPYRYQFARKERDIPQ